jgi:hypothetical protein
MTGIAFTPQRMKSTLNLLGGPALPTQFITMVLPPAGMLSSGEFGVLAGTWAGAALGYAVAGVGTAALSIMTEKAAIPGKAFATSPVVMHGQHRLMPHSALHDTFRMTFICSNSMIERTFFDLWMQFIQKPDSHYMEYFDTYKSTVIIKKMSGSGLVDSLLADPSSTPTANNPLVEVGSLLSTYYLQEAYPVRIGAQELSSGDTQSYLSLDVEFAYTHVRCVLDDIVPAIFGGPHETVEDLAGGPIMGPFPEGVNIPR